MRMWAGMLLADSAKGPAAEHHIACLLYACAPASAAHGVGCGVHAVHAHTVAVRLALVRQGVQADAWARKHVCSSSRASEGSGANCWMLTGHSAPSHFLTSALVVWKSPPSCSWVLSNWSSSGLSFGLSPEGALGTLPPSPPDWPSPLPLYSPAPVLKLGLEEEVESCSLSSPELAMACAAVYRLGQ